MTLYEALKNLATEHVRFDDDGHWSVGPVEIPPSAIPAYTDSWEVVLRELDMIEVETR